MLRVLPEDASLAPLFDRPGRIVRHRIAQPLVEIPRAAPAQVAEFVEEIPGKQPAARSQLQNPDGCAGSVRFLAVGEQHRGGIRRKAAVVVHNVRHATVGERVYSLAVPGQARELPLQALRHGTVILHELFPRRGPLQGFGGGGRPACQPDPFEPGGSGKGTRLKGSCMCVIPLHCAVEDCRWCVAPWFNKAS